MKKWLVVTGAFASLAGVLLLCLHTGARPLDFSALTHALLASNGSSSDLVVLYLRLPRVLLAMIVGAALGTAGALMQGLTRNPLADPAIFGVNGGASLALVILLQYRKAPTPFLSYAVALVGASVAVCLVYAIARVLSRADLRIGMTVSGAILSGLFASLVTAILVANGHDLVSIQFWLAGSLNGRDWPAVVATIPPVAIGLAVAFAMGRRLNAMALGEQVAKGLGVGVTATWIWGTLGFLFLTAAAVAVAGPIGFVGLLLPHGLRPFIGGDYERLLPMCALNGAVFLSLCDLAARSSVVAYRDEIPVGIICALLGTPMLLLVLARRQLMV